MIINLKNSKNLSTNDLRNSYQVQWWYIHEFYTDSLSFAVLSLVNSSLEQTHRCNINYYLDNQYHTLKNVPSESEFLFGEVITPSKCKKKKKLHQFPQIFGCCTQSECVPKEPLWSIPETLQQQP